MTRLLITGSRQASPEMLHYVYRLVEYAREKGWSIIVGDAEGVDSAVVDNCWAQGVAFTCYGISQRPRLPTCSVRGFIAAPEYEQVGRDYLDRDRYMVSQCDRVMAVWNGVSRGTRYTYDYAVAHHKKAEIRTFLVEGTELYERITYPRP